jgi:hypothetical protein
MIYEIIGWVGSVLLLSAYSLNILGKLKSTSILYILGNLFGGICFVINTLYHNAYPSALVNFIWVIFALITIIKR